MCAPSRWDAHASGAGGNAVAAEAQRQLRRVQSSSPSRCACSPTAVAVQQACLRLHGTHGTPQRSTCLEWHLHLRHHAGKSALVSHVSGDNLAAALHASMQAGLACCMRSRLLVKVVHLVLAVLLSAVPRRHLHILPHGLTCQWDLNWTSSRPLELNTRSISRHRSLVHRLSRGRGLPPIPQLRRVQDAARQASLLKMVQLPHGQHPRKRRRCDPHDVVTHSFNRIEVPPPSRPVNSKHSISVYAGAVQHAPGTRHCMRCPKTCCAPS